MQWNHDGLGHDRLSADALSVIFPDGEIYEAPGSDLLPEPVDLARLPASVDTFTFHASLAILKPHGGNVDANGRYACNELETPDLFSEALA
ncbi:type VI secretion system baseplate subunit TssK, partial [Acinetobacter baumannii]|nr:type VI secretion system baseplate subunit TssK [Acinetobacter baumannii]